MPKNNDNKKVLDAFNYKPKNTSSAAVNKKSPSSKSTTDKNTATDTKKILEAFNYVPPQKREYNLTLNGKTYGTVSYGAMKALENNKLDKYTPKNEEEKKALAQYRFDSFKEKVKAFGKNNSATLDPNSEEAKLAKRYGIDVNTFSTDDLFNWAQNHNFTWSYDGATGGDFVPARNGFFGKKLTTEQEEKDYEVLKALAGNNARRATASKDTGKTTAAAYGTLSGLTMSLANKLLETQTKKTYEKAGLTPEKYVSTNEALNPTLSEHPIAYTVGDVAGGFVPLVIGGSAITSALGAIPKYAAISEQAAKGVGKAIKTKRMIDSMATLGTLTSIESSTNQDFKNHPWASAGNVVKDTLTSAFTAYLGSKASGKVADKLLPALQKTNLSSKAIKVIASGTGALSFAGTAIIAKEVENMITCAVQSKEYKPNWQQIGSSLVTLTVLSSLLTYVQESVSTTAPQAEEKFKWFSEEDVSSPEALKKRYRELTKQYHPDKFKAVGGEAYENAEAAMAEINSEHQRAIVRFATKVAEDIKTSEQYTGEEKAAKTKAAVDDAVVLLNDIYDEDTPVNHPGVSTPAAEEASSTNETPAANTETPVKPITPANVVSNELGEIMSAGEIATYAPVSASDEIKRLESILISKGTDDASRQSIINTAVNIEQALGGNEKTIRNVFNATAKMTSEAVSEIKNSAGLSNAYWKLFGENFKAIANGNAVQTAGLVTTYAKAYTDALKSSNPEKYNSVFVTADGTDISAGLTDTILSNKIPTNAQNPGEYRIAATKVKGIIAVASEKIANERNAIYGPGENNTAQEVANTEQGTVEIQPGSEVSEEPRNITLTRVGDFYEAYGDDAVELADKLNLKVSQKQVNGEYVPMIGFPVSSMAEYQNTLGEGYTLSVSDAEETPVNERYVPDEYVPDERYVSSGTMPGEIVSLKHTRNVYSLFKGADRIAIGKDFITDGFVLLPLTDEVLAGVKKVAGEIAPSRLERSLSDFGLESNQVLIEGVPKSGDAQHRGKNVKSYLFKIDGKYYGCQQQYIDTFNNGKNIIYANEKNAAAPWAVYNEKGNFVGGFMGIRTPANADVVYESLPSVSDILAEDKQKKADNAAKPFNQNELRQLLHGNHSPFFFTLNGSNYITNGSIFVKCDENATDFLKGEYDGLAHREDMGAKVNEMFSSAKEITVSPESFAYDKKINAYVVEGKAVAYSKQYASIIEKRSSTIKILSGGKFTTTYLAGYDTDGNLVGCALPIIQEGTATTKDGRKIPFATADDLKAFVEEAKEPATLQEKATGVNSENELKTEYPHMYDEKKVSKDYLNSVNTEIENAIINIRNGNLDAVPAVIEVTELSDEAIKKISEFLGFDISGYTCKIERDRLVHIENRHGINGEHDHSLSDPKDIARLGYIINYGDKIEWAVNNKGDRRFDKKYNDKNNKSSPVIAISRKIDGTYCVSQAVPDSKQKTVWITSARIQKAAVGSQVLHGGSSTPQLQTSETSLASSSASNDNITQDSKSVNSGVQNKIKAADVTDKYELIKTKHTANGSDIWVVRIKDRLSAEDFRALSGKVKEVGGYYSHFAKTLDGENAAGFVFKTEPSSKELSVFSDYFKSSEVITSKEVNNAEKPVEAKGNAVEGRHNLNVKESGVNNNVSGRADSNVGDMGREVGERANVSDRLLRRESAEDARSGEERDIRGREEDDSGNRAQTFKDEELIEKKTKTGVGDIYYSEVKNEALKDNEEAQFIKEQNEKCGIKTVFVSGSIKLVTDKIKKDAKGFAYNGVVYLQIDNENYTAAQINDHEIVHINNKTEAFKTLRKSVFDKLTDMQKEGVYQSLLTKYGKVFGESYDARNKNATKEQRDKALKEYLQEEAIGNLNAGIDEMADYAEDFTAELEAFRKAIETTTEETAETEEKKGEENPAEYAEETDSGGRALFVGKTAKTANESLYKQALEMEADGKSKEDILKETGWLKGADGKWRFEISDRKLKFTNRFNEYKPMYKNSTVMMRDTINHIGLFAAYPSVANMTLTFEDLGYNDGYYSADTNSIHLNNSLLNNEQELKETLIHEIQHAIQSYEGFAEGSSPGYWRKQIADNKIASSMQNASPESLYINTAGEIEARDSANRIDMTDEERRNTFPESAKENPDRVFAEGSTFNYNFNENFSEQIDDWLAGQGQAFKSYNGKYFELGTTPYVFVKHGAPNTDIRMDESVLVKVTGGKHAISLDEIKQLPTQLNDPILLFKSTYKDKHGNIKPAFVALTELTDIHGNDVIVAVHLNKYSDRLRVNKIASVYSKSDDTTFENRIVPYVTQQIKNGNLLDASIKKAPTWFTSRGLQLPKLVQTIIDTNSSIAQNSSVVNTNSADNSKQAENAAPRFAFDDMSDDELFEMFTDDVPVQDEVIKRAKENFNIDKSNRLMSEAFKEVTAMAAKEAPTINFFEVGKLTQNIIKSLHSKADVAVVGEKAVRAYNEYLKELKESGGVAELIDEAETHFLEAMYDVAADVVKGIEIMPQADDYRDLAAYLRGTTLKLSEDYASEVKDFRQKYRGIKVSTKEGVPIDSFYKELQAAFPGMFDENVQSNPVDQLNHIGETLQSLKPQAYNPFMTGEAAIEDGIQTVLEQFAGAADDVIQSSRGFDEKATKEKLAEQAERKKRQAERRAELKKIREEKGEEFFKLLQTAEEYKNKAVENMLRNVEQKQDYEAKLKEQKEKAKEQLEKKISAQKEKSEERIAKLKERYGDKADAIKEKADERLKAQKQKVEERLEKKIDAEKAKAEEKLTKEKERGEKRVEAAKKNKDRVISNMRERRQASALRSAIRAKGDDLSRRVLATNDKGAAAELVQSIADICSKLDFTTDRTGKDGGISKSNLRLLELKKKYDALKNDTDYDIASEYDEEISKYIAELDDVLEGKKVSELSVSELSDLNELLKQIRHSIIYANRQIGASNAALNKDLGRSIIDEFAKQKGFNRNFVTSFLTKYASEGMNPMRIARLITAYDDSSQFYKSFAELEEGYSKKRKFYADAHRMFDPLVSGGNAELYKDFTTKLVNTGMKYEDGTAVMLPKSMICELIMLWDREQGRSHLEKGGVTIPDMKKFNAGKIKEAFTTGQKTVPSITAADISRLNGMLDKYDREWMAKSRKFFNETAPKVINETAMLLTGRKKATTQNYIPIHTDKNYVRTEIEGVKLDASIEGSGTLKSVVPNASQPVYLMGLDYTTNEHIDFASDYYGLAVPIRNFNKVYNVTVVNEDETRNSVKNVIGQKWGKDIKEKVIEQTITDLQTSRRRDDGIAARALGALQSNFVAATLNGNISVCIKQAASYPTAAYVVGMKPLLKALGTHVSNAELFAEIDAHTGAHYVRRQGLSTQELGDRATANNFIKRATDAIDRQLTKIPGVSEKVLPSNWIQNIDVVTTKNLWLASKYYVEDTLKISKEADNYWDKVTETYESIISETQPNYDVLHRPEIQKTTNTLVRYLVMFQTQPLQNSGILYESIAKTMAKREAYKQNKTAENKAAYTEAKKQSGRASEALISSAVTFTLMTLMARMLLHKLKRYRDEKEGGEVTWRKILENTAGDFGEQFVNMFVPIYGSNIMNVVKGYDIEVSAVTMFNDTRKAVTDLNTALQKLSTSGEGGVDEVVEASKDMITQVLKLGGVPAENYRNIVEGAMKWGKDIMVEGFGESDINEWKPKYIYTYSDLAAAIATGDSKKEAKISGYFDDCDREVNKAQLTKQIKPVYLEALKNDKAKAARIKRTLIKNYGYKEKTIDDWSKDKDT